MSEQKRTTLAITVCLLSGLLGVYLLMHGKSRAWTAFDIGCVWTITADWLGRRLWLLGISIGQVHKEAKRGGLTMTGIARAMSICGTLLLGAAVVVGLTS